MLPEEIEKLRLLHEQGALTDEEFEAAKGQLIKTDRATAKSSALLGLELKSYLTLLHASQFASFIIPGAGLAAPFILWSMAKEQYPEVDTEGKAVLNWVISEIIYVVVAIIICFTLVGIIIAIPLMIILVIAGMILPLIGMMEASQGRSYKYPCTIEFLK
jgi:hypothetical protein